MSGKKVSFGSKPSSKPVVTTTADEWVGRRDEGGGATKRLTLDIPAGLHRAIKVSCAGRGTKMAEEIRALLEQHFKQP